MAKYPKVKAGEWVKPKRKRYKMACCDCGLVHDMEFRVVKYAKGKRTMIYLRAWRNERATGQMRRHMPNVKTIKASDESA